MVNACPRNNKFTKKANICTNSLKKYLLLNIAVKKELFPKDTIIHNPPNKNIITKSAVRPRNDPSSSIRQYRYVNIMLKKKLNPNVPKNRKEVKSLHTCPCFKINIGLKYNWKGDAKSNCWK